LKPGEADKQTSYQEIPRLNKHTRGNQIYRTFFFSFSSLRKIAMETRRHTASFRFEFLLFHPLLIRSRGEGTPDRVIADRPDLLPQVFRL
jgi:hypothetical protein